MAWSGEHRAFVIEEFVKNSESVVATQRSFRRHFSLNRHDPVPTGKIIQQRKKMSQLWQTQLSNLPDVPSESTHLPCTCPLQVCIEFCTGHSICIPTR